MEERTIDQRIENIFNFLDNYIKLNKLDIDQLTATISICAENRRKKQMLGQEKDMDLYQVELDSRTIKRIMMERELKYINR